MRPRPFPLPLSVGTDIVKISRIANILLEQLNAEPGTTYIAHGRKFANRIFCQQELPLAYRYLSQLDNSIKSGLASCPTAVQQQNKLAKWQSGLQNLPLPAGRVAQWFAGRFAAKEAVIKAHRSRRLTFKDIWIYAPPVGKDGASTAPVALVRDVDGPEDGWAKPQACSISISHDGGSKGWAVATCMASEEIAKNTQWDIPEEIDREDLDWDITEDVDDKLARIFQNTTASPEEAGHGILEVMPKAGAASTDPATFAARFLRNLDRSLNDSPSASKAIEDTKKFRKRDRGIMRSKLEAETKAQCLKVLKFTLEDMFKQSPNQSARLDKKPPIAKTKSISKSILKPTSPEPIIHERRQRFTTGLLDYVDRKESYLKDCMRGPIFKDSEDIKPIKAIRQSVLELRRSLHITPFQDTWKRLNDIIRRLSPFFLRSTSTTASSTATSLQWINADAHPLPDPKAQKAHEEQEQIKGTRLSRGQRETRTLSRGIYYTAVDDMIRQLLSNDVIFEEIFKEKYPMGSGDLFLPNEIQEIESANDKDSQELSKAILRGPTPENTLPTSGYNPHRPEIATGIVGRAPVGDAHPPRNLSASSGRHTRPNTSVSSDAQELQHALSENIIAQMTEPSTTDLVPAPPAPDTSQQLQHSTDSIKESFEQDVASLGDGGKGDLPVNPQTGVERVETQQVSIESDPSSVFATDKVDTLGRLLDFLEHTEEPIVAESALFKTSRETSALTGGDKKSLTSWKAIDISQPITTAGTGGAYRESPRRRRSRDIWTCSHCQAEFDRRNALFKHLETCPPWRYQDTGHTMWCRVELKKPSPGGDARPDQENTIEASEEGNTKGSKGLLARPKAFFL